MFFRLLVAFIVIPFVELVLLLKLADATDWFTTLLLVVVTGIIGSYLARREGIAAWFRFQTALTNGKMPGREIQDGLMIAFAAALLLTPGLLTDALGFTLLTPPGRRVIGGWLRRRFAGSFQMQTFGTGPTSRSNDASPGHELDSDEVEGPQYVRPNSSGRGDTIDSPHFEPKQHSST